MIQSFNFFFYGGLNLGYILISGTKIVWSRYKNYGIILLKNNNCMNLSNTSLLDANLTGQNRPEIRWYKTLL